MQEERDRNLLSSTKDRIILGLLPKRPPNTRGDTVMWRNETDLRLIWSMSTASNKRVMGEFPPSKHQADCLCEKKETETHFLRRKIISSWAYGPYLHEWNEIKEKLEGIVENIFHPERLRAPGKRLVCWCVQRMMDWRGDWWPLNTHSPRIKPLGSHRSPGHIHVNIMKWRYKERIICCTQLVDYILTRLAQRGEYYATCKSDCGLHHI